MFHERSKCSPLALTHAVRWWRHCWTAHVWRRGLASSKQSSKWQGNINIKIHIYCTGSVILAKQSLADRLRMLFSRSLRTSNESYKLKSSGICNRRITHKPTNKQDQSHNLCGGGDGTTIYCVFVDQAADLVGPLNYSRRLSRVRSAYDRKTFWVPSAKRNCMLHGLRRCPLQAEAAINDRQKPTTILSSPWGKLAATHEAFCLWSLRNEYDCIRSRAASPSYNAFLGSTP